jgi:GTP cyclohydrolase I
MNHKSRKDAIMYALEQLNLAKCDIKEGLKDTPVMRIQSAMTEIMSALDIAPTISAIDAVVEASREDVRTQA